VPVVTPGLRKIETETFFRVEGMVVANRGVGQRRRGVQAVPGDCHPSRRKQRTPKKSGRTADSSKGDARKGTGIWGTGGRTMAERCGTQRCSTIRQ